MDKDDRVTKISFVIEDGTLTLNATIDHTGVDLLSRMLTDLRAFMEAPAHER